MPNSYLCDSYFVASSQDAGAERTIWAWAVLGGDFRLCGGLPLTPALSPAIYRAERGRYCLLAFGDQAFVAVQVIAALGLA
ncbi:MAG: hypothetical protein EXR90_00440 [Methyloglobulus sp.]|nr:hypothetical protein [Methyloglobulus sp.]